jgi:hypothetical protein
VSTAPDERLWRSVPAVRHLVVELAGIQALSAGLTVAQAVVLADVIVAIFLGGDDVADVLPRLLLLAGVGCCRALLAAVQELVAGRASTGSGPSCARLACTPCAGSVPAGPSSNRLAAS